MRVARFAAVQRSAREGLPRPQACGARGQHEQRGAAAAHHSTSKPSASSLAMVSAPSTSWSVATGMLRKDLSPPDVASTCK